MTIRLPLLAKIVGWFLLNLVVLGVAGWLLLRESLGFSMLASRTAGERVSQVAGVIASEMNAAPRAEWDKILAKHEQQRGVNFHVFTNEGTPLAGTLTQLPPEVHSRVAGVTGPPPRRPLREDDGRPPRDEGRPPRDGAGPPFELDGRAPRAGDGPPPRDPQRRPPRDDRGGPPPFEDDFGPPDGPRGPRGGGGAGGANQPRVYLDKLLIQSHRPERYWVIARVMLKLSGVERQATVLAVSDSPVGHGLYFDSTPLLWAGAGVLLLTVLVWFPLVRGITHSIGQMRAAASQLADGNFETRVDSKRSDELGELGADINRMAGRLSGYVDGQRRFLGDVAHELCAPVARLQMAVGILEHNATTPTQKEHLADVRDEVEHMAGLVNELLQFTRASMSGKKVDTQRVELKHLAEKAVHREALDISQVKIEIEETLAVLAAPDLLQRALSNLVRNAIRYAGHAGPITVSALRDGSDVFVSVTDQGTGVPADALPKLFDPFYRVDTVRTPGAPGAGGTGLGLAIVKTCVEACSGSVSARNVEPHGFEVTMRLPAA